MFSSHGAINCLATLARPAWLPGGSYMTYILSAKQFCFEDEMCFKVKCSKCQKTTWKGKHVINSLSLLCERVSRWMYMRVSEYFYCGCPV